MNTPMMKCGHAANATTVRDGKTIPCCIICAPDKGAYITTDSINLTDRKARCGYYGKHRRNGSCDYGGTDQPDRICRCETESSSKLPFFEYRPTQPFDMFYCGCHGWD